MFIINVYALYVFDLTKKSMSFYFVILNEILFFYPFAVDFMRGVSCHKTKDLGLCKIWKRLGYCITMKKRIAKYCPHECGFCSELYAEFQFDLLQLYHQIVNKSIVGKSTSSIMRKSKNARQPKGIGAGV